MWPLAVDMNQKAHIVMFSGLIRDLRCSLIEIFDYKNTGERAVRMIGML